MKRKSKKNRKFKMFVKQYDEDGAIVFHRCGWINANPELMLVDNFSDAQTFEDKEPGHGSFEDWKDFFNEEHPNWEIIVRYLDE